MVTIAELRSTPTVSRIAHGHIPIVTTTERRCPPLVSISVPGTFLQRA